MSVHSDEQRRGQLPVNGAFLRQLANRLTEEGDSIVIHKVTAATPTKC